jgi:hypothetical protein
MTGRGVVMEELDGGEGRKERWLAGPRDVSSGREREQKATTRERRQTKGEDSPSSLHFTSGIRRKSQRPLNMAWAKRQGPWQSEFGNGRLEGHALQGEARP